MTAQDQGPGPRTKDQGSGAGAGAGQGPGQDPEPILEAETGPSQWQWQCCGPQDPLPPHTHMEGIKAHTHDPKAVRRQKWQRWSGREREIFKEREPEMRAKKV